jgi:hypothetical protein
VLRSLESATLESPSLEIATLEAEGLWDQRRASATDQGGTASLGRGERAATAAARLCEKMASWMGSLSAVTPPAPDPDSTSIRRLPSAVTCASRSRMSRRPRRSRSQRSRPSAVT